MSYFNSFCLYLHHYLWTQVCKSSGKCRHPHKSENDILAYSAHKLQFYKTCKIVIAMSEQIYTLIWWWWRDRLTYVRPTAQFLVQYVKLDEIIKLIKSVAPSTLWSATKIKGYKRICSARRSKHICPRIRNTAKSTHDCGYGQPRRLRSSFHQHVLPPSAIAPFLSSPLVSGMDCHLT